MSLIADALQKSSNPSGSNPNPNPGSNPNPTTNPTPTPNPNSMNFNFPPNFPQPPKRKARWSYAILAIAFVALVFVVAKNIPVNSTKKAYYYAAGSMSDPTPKSRRSGISLLQAANSQWRLSGTVHGGTGKPLALINNSIVEEGAHIRGARVVKVTEKNVELETDSGATKTIRLQ